MKRILILVYGLGLMMSAPMSRAAGVDAVVEWSQRVELGVPVSGVIAKVNVASGDRVNRGQTLLALDDAPFKAAVKEAQALVTRRKLELAAALRDYKQAKELYDRTVLSTVEFDDARTKHALAEAALRAAQATLDEARYRLRVSAIQAPFDGIVIQRLGQPGQAISAELKPQTLLVFAAGGEYVARARLPAERIAGLSAGQAVSVSVGGEKFPARIRNVGLEPAATGDAAGPQYEIEVVFAASSMLRAGQRATVELP